MALIRRRMPHRVSRKNELAEYRLHCKDNYWLWTRELPMWYTIPMSLVWIAMLFSLVLLASVFDIYADDGELLRMHVI